MRKEFVINDVPTSITNLHLDIKYNDGFAAYLNGNEIARRAMPAGPLDSTVLATPHQDTNFESIDLALHMDRIARGRNFLAVELHLSATNDLDLVWDAQLTYTLNANQSGDTDGDGMPDVWEDQFGFASNDPSDAAADSDNDGLSNLEEFLAGTDPRETNSCLRLIEILPQSSGTILRWNSVVGKAYQIQASDDLIGWNNTGSIFNASNSVTEYLLPADLSPERQFYRIKLVP